MRHVADVHRIASPGRPGGIKTTKSRGRSSEETHLGFSDLTVATVTLSMTLQLTKTMMP